MLKFDTLYTTVQKKQQHFKGHNHLNITMDRRERFVRKRNSIVGDAMAKFEGAEAANKFARRHSLYSRAVRQSIPDIRFDEHGVPISTRQFLARSQSIAGAVGGSSEQYVRRLSKSFFADDDDASDGVSGGVKPNFTIPSTTRAGMLGSNRRWSIRPDWMANKKRRPSVKEEFIEKNLQNIEILPPALRRSSSSEETDRETPDIERQILEDIADESEELEIDSDSGSGTPESDSPESESSSFLSCLSSGLEEEKSDLECENLDEEIFTTAVENVSEIAVIEEKNDELKKNPEEVRPERRESKSERRRSNTERRESKSDRRNSKAERRQSNSQRRRSNAERRKSRDRRRSSAKEDTLPPRPSPPPLPIQMCNVSDYWNSSSSEDEDSIVTKYGKQKLFVSNCFHVFEFRNEVEEVSFSKCVTGRVATCQGSVRENKIFSRSGKSQGILKKCQGILAI